MRIITGKARGIKLLTLEGDATRPTSERAKEAVFSMLQFDIEGRTVLDVFGGSGQLALEAMSRGAASCVIGDVSAAAVKIITQNAEKTKLIGGCRIFRADWTELLRRVSGEKFDIVFLDPPYAAGLIPKILPILESYLKPTSTVVCEAGEELFGTAPDGYEIVKKCRYGVAYVTLLKPIKEMNTK